MFVGNVDNLNISLLGSALINVENGYMKSDYVLAIHEIKKHLIYVNQLTSEYPYTFEFL